MTRQEFIHAVTNILHENGVQKPVSVPRHALHICDDEGNKKDFFVKSADKMVPYTTTDVREVVDACLYVIEDAIKHGETITMRGYGSLGVIYRRPRRTKMVGTGETVYVEGRYIPRFFYGDILRRAARTYELSLADANAPKSD